MQPVGPDPNSNQNMLDNTRCRSPLPQSNNNDGPPGTCDVDPSNLNAQPSTIGSWNDIANQQNLGLGSDNNCDPMQSGSIINDLNPPSESTIYRYGKTIRATFEAVMNLFRKLIILDEDGKAHPVPIVHGTQERAVALIVQENVRKDSTLVVDRLVLPYMAIKQSGISVNKEKYMYHRNIRWFRGADGKPGFTAQEKYKKDTVFGATWGIPVKITYDLYVWTKHVEDMNQLIEQIILKFSPVAYISVRGVDWETIVTLDEIGNNIDFEPGDGKLRIVKYQYSITAQTYIQQPLIRRKSILETRIEMVNSSDPENVTEVINRLDKSVKEVEEQ